MLDDILTEIGGDAADPAELELVLLSYFHHSMQPTNDTLIYGSQEQPALELKYAKSGSLSSLRPGPAFSDKDLSELCRIVREQLLIGGPVKIERMVMFCGLPTDGWFRFQDEFQLLPVPPDAPRPPHPVGEHPLLLEVAYSGSGNTNVDMLRLGKRQREIEILCNLLLVPNVHGQSRFTVFHWVYEPIIDGKITSTYRQGGYAWDGASIQPDEFSNTDGLQQLVQSDPQAYYTQRGIHIGESLGMPANFTHSLELVRALPGLERERFLRASYWYLQSFKASLISNSIAFAALVSAIEALRPDPPKDVGLRRAFIDFVDRFVPEIPLRDRQRFYELRSAISHGGKLLHSDEVAWGFGLQQTNHYNDIRLLSEIVRAVLVNWLHTPYPRI